MCTFYFLRMKYGFHLEYHLVFMIPLYNINLILFIDKRHGVTKAMYPIARRFTKRSVLKIKTFCFV